jgi:N-acetylglucosaminyl-diphospho-decaprenol L-rhamnosyltransferase
MIDRVCEFLDNHPEAAGVGGNLINPDGSFQSGACSFPTLMEEFLNVTKLGLLIRSCYPSLPPFQKERQVDWLGSAFILLRRKAIEAIGLVDENFFIYSDETDLAYRLWSAGWKIYYLPDVRTIHFGGKSLKPWVSRKLLYRGRLLFFHKHHSLLEEIILRILFLTASSIKIIFWLFAYLIPRSRDRAKNELGCQVGIFKLSLDPKIRR